MPAYKDAKTGTWCVQCYYKDWNGERKHKKKRGFSTQREAKEYEREFLLAHAGDPKMTFASLLCLYYADAENHIRPTTIETKQNMIKTHILPYFEKMQISDIDNSTIRNWQNVMLKKINPHTQRPYAPTYLRSVNTQLSAIFNFAMQYYKLPQNPCRATRTIGKKQADEMKFWTLKQFNQAIAFETKDAYRLAFLILYWGGLREGECLALTKQNLLRENHSLDIRHTYHRRKGQDILGPTKTKNSERTTSLPVFVFDEIIAYVDSVYALGETDRIFYFTKSALNKELDYIAKASGVERIRVHDLRHSHVSLLIELGYQIHAIAKRIGDSPEMVNKTYAHLYPNKDADIAGELQKHINGINKVYTELE